jgi:hypothetical protein
VPRGGAVTPIRMKVYFDTVIVSATVMSDLPTGEMAAVERLVAAFADGKIDVETSRLTWDEQDGAKETIKSKLLAVRESFPVVPNDTKLLGIDTIYYEGGFMSAPRLTGIMDEALHKTFRAAGLKERDAQDVRGARSLRSLRYNRPPLPQKPATNLRGIVQRTSN